MSTGVVITFAVLIMAVTLIGWKLIVDGVEVLRWRADQARRNLQNHDERVVALEAHHVDSHHVAERLESLEKRHVDAWHQIEALQRQVVSVAAAKLELEKECASLREMIVAAGKDRKPAPIRAKSFQEFKQLVDETDSVGA